MLKHLIILFVLSLGIIVGMQYAHQGVEWLLAGHDWVSRILTDVFSGGQAGNIAKGFIALLTIPFLIALVPAVIYWIVRRHWFPYFMQIVWVVWLIQAGALVMTYQVAAGV
jgi:hypothetical protein